MYCLTRKELTAILEKAIGYDVLDVIFEADPEKPGRLGTLVCDAAYANREKAVSMQEIGVDTWVGGVWEGRYEIDLDAVLKVIEEREKTSLRDALAAALERSEETGGAAGLDVLKKELF